ncbi:MAG TPA: response regulator, partial [Cellvibrionaceae bacterium]|nr:response regulator [Cellvibrionaceae bacterium]
HETPLAIEVLERDLTRLGFQVTSAHSAADALSLTEGRARAGEAFSLALVDWRLSTSNGLSLARQLHDINPEPLGVILLLTQREKEQLAQHQGHDAQFLWQLSKPIVRPALEQVLRLVLAGDQAAPDQAAAPQILAGVSLLVVEDNALNRQVAAELLGGVGAKVSLAVDGRDGVNKATARGAAYDLILMDLQMPVMDGLEATRQLRKQGLNLPILAMTANASAEDKDECLAAGMDGHLSKPIDLNLVVAAIRQALGNTGQVAVAAEAELAAAAGIEPAPTLEQETDQASHLVDADLDESAEALSADADAEFVEGAAEVAGPVPDAHLEQEQEQEQEQELPVAQALTSGIETQTEARAADEELDLGDLEESLPVVDFFDLLGDELDNEEEPQRAPEDRPEAEAQPAEAQDDLARDTRDAAAPEAAPLFQPPPESVPEGPPGASPQSPAQPQAPVEPSFRETEPPAGDWVDGLDDILRRFGGKRALYQKMLANLGPETERLIAELNSAALAQDRERASTAAHSIKGTAATLGAKALSQRAAWLEKRIKTSDGPLEEILTPEAFEALAEALAGALTALDQALAA